jgi:S-disulfanyl-L-cysteine oxidoreductase SoxD
MMRRIAFAVGLSALGACNGGQTADAAPRYALGSPASAADIAPLDIDIGSDGEGLPAGSGTVEQGAALYKGKCAVCHGPNGEGIAPLYPAVIGRDPKGESFGFGKDYKLTRTIGNYWPYATTVYDYVRRTMPLTAPGSLTSDEVYAVTAYLLAANQVIAMNATLDAQSLRQVKMPAAGRFVPDNRRGGREVK